MQIQLCLFGCHLPAGLQNLLLISKIIFLAQKRFTWPDKMLATSPFTTNWPPKFATENALNSKDLSQSGGNWAPDCVANWGQIVYKGCGQIEQTECGKLPALAQSGPKLATILFANLKIWLPVVLATRSVYVFEMKCFAGCSLRFLLRHLQYFKAFRPNNTALFWHSACRFIPLPPQLHGQRGKDVSPYGPWGLFFLCRTSGGSSQNA